MGRVSLNQDRSGEPQPLSREDILAGRIDDALLEGERLGLVRHVSPEERARSRADVIANYPDRDDGIWVFSYGSLMWNPTFMYDLQVPGTVFGYHRRFCLRSGIGRGTPDRPAFVLGLDRGGSCHGIAFRIPRRMVEEELKLIWDREMVGHAYMARILNIRTEQSVVPAIGFVMDRTSTNYVGRLPDAEVAEAIAHAEGQIGTCREYLFETAEHLAEIGLVDRYISRMTSLVRARLAESSQDD